MKDWYRLKRQQRRCINCTHYAEAEHTRCTSCRENNKRTSRARYHAMDPLAKERVRLRNREAIRARRAAAEVASASTPEVPRLPDPLPPER